MIFLDILRLITIIIVAFIAGKLISLLKMPQILGWLITGMIFGPHLVGLLNQQILDATWYQVVVNLLECFVGVLIGSELVWKKIKKSGTQIIVTTFTQSIGTFLLVSLVFGITFYFMDIPLYLAVIFGGIALATAPAPALSIVNEFKTSGPVTSSLIPMAALDDIVGVIIFFTSISIISSMISTQATPIYMMVLIILLPLVIGGVIGFLAGLLLKRNFKPVNLLLILIGSLLLTGAVGVIFNLVVFDGANLNFMLMGMAFSCAFANMIPQEKLDKLLKDFNPILGFSMIIVILNLGCPLDYKLILGAGLFTVIYIVSRAFGKYFGALFGSVITKAPSTVKKYLGLTLLPHSGVSLVFTGIAVNMLLPIDPAAANILQGTIASAAIINEVIAVIISKYAFKWAGELNKA